MIVDEYKSLLEKFPNKAEILDCSEFFDEIISTKDNDEIQNITIAAKYSCHIMEYLIKMFENAIDQEIPTSHQKISNDIKNYTEKSAFVVKFKDKWYFFFMDTCMMAQPNPENPNGVEYFYHTPSFPEIAIEQATLLKNWFKQHPEKEYLVQAPSERFAKNPELAKRTYREFYKELEEIAEIIKLVCYPFWDFNRFQAEKPFAVLEGFKMGTRGWDNILTALPDFDRVQQKWEYNWKSYLSMIDQSFLRNRDTLQTIRSKAHIINH